MNKEFMIKTHEESLDDRIFNIFTSLANIESSLNIMCRSMENEQAIHNVEDYLNMIYLLKDEIRANMDSLDKIETKQ